MLVHLRLAGMLDEVTGIVFGDMRQCVGPEQMELLEAAILHSLREFRGPIAIGLAVGACGWGERDAAAGGGCAT